jgi:ubiquinone/menaquinone biosynthesis C-methylase UbiE
MKSTKARNISSDQMKQNDSDYWDKWSEEYADEYGELPYFVKWGFDRIISRLDLKDGSTILDLGTGSGILIRILSGRNKKLRFIGVDISKGQLKLIEEYCKKNKIDAKFIVGDMTRLDMPDGSVDSIVSNAAIHHVKDKKKLFSEIYRVLKKGGKIVFSDFYEVAGDRYKKETTGMIKKHPKEAANFTESIKQSESELPEDLKNNHPPEYHVDPYELKAVMESIKFKNVEVVKTFDTFFTIIEGTR